MTKEEFMEKLRSLLPAPDDKATASWGDWTADLDGREDIELDSRNICRFGG